MAKELGLIPTFKAGEHLTIQRDVNGKNVLMVVTVEDPCSIGPRGIVLRAKLNTWGESSYADGRVAQQVASIERLLKHVQIHCSDPGNCEEFRATQEEGTSNGNNDTEADASAEGHHQG